VNGYLVDTNIPSELTRAKPNPRVEAFLRNAAQSSVFLSVITIGEICKGIDSLPAGAKRSLLQNWLDMEVRSWFTGRILPISEDIAEQWGHLAAAAKQRGFPLTVADGLIAATALHHNLTLVTRNMKDFVTLRVDLLNPWEP